MCIIYTVYMGFLVDIIVRFLQRSEVKVSQKKTINLLLCATIENVTLHISHRQYRRSTPEQHRNGIELEIMINYYHQLQRCYGEWLVVSCATRLHILDCMTDHLQPRPLRDFMAWTHHRNRRRLVHIAHIIYVVQGARMMPANYSGHHSTHASLHLPEPVAQRSTKVGFGHFGKGFLPIATG